MKQLVVPTYATNAAQVINMTAFALVLPLAIGFEQYGIYVSLFALPGIMQGMIETMYTVHLSRHPLTTADLRTWAVFTALAAVAVATGHRLLIHDGRAHLAAIILFALSARSLVGAVVYGCQSVNILRANVTVEVMTTLVYALTFTFGKLMHLSGYALPLTMLLASQVVGVVYFVALLHGLRVRPCRTDKRFSGTVFRFALSRSYEDTLFTLQPLAVAMFAGNVAAGQYRYMVSVTKAIAKVFPVRYEMLTRHNESIDRRLVLWLAGLSAIAGLFAYAGFLGAELFIPAIRNPAHTMLLGSGLAVFATTFLPLLAREDPWIMARVLPLAALVVVSPSLGGLPLTVGTFIAANAVAFIMIAWLVYHRQPTHSAASPLAEATQRD